MPEDVPTGRVVRKFRPGEKEEWEATVAEIKAETRDLVERDRLRKAAMKEESLSGQLRRAIRDRGTDYPKLTKESGVDALEVADFMCGISPLDSDAFGRLAEACDLELSPVKRA